MSKKNTAEQIELTQEMEMIEEMDSFDGADEEPDYPSNDSLRAMFMSLTKKDLL